MKPETTARHFITDLERNTALKLIGCGLSNVEIAEIMHISKSSVSYIRQAHTACINKDWEALQKLSTSIRPTVDWAMKVTGTDKAFLETFGKPAPEADTTASESAPTEVAVDPITREDFVEMRGLLSGIYNLLTEIRDILK